MEIMLYWSPLFLEDKMKKLLSILLMVLVVGFCFADEALEVEENSNSVDLSVLETQNQLLQLLNENQLNQDSLNAIAATNEVIAEEHEAQKAEIEYNKTKNVIKRNLKNRPNSYLAIGFNVPLQLNTLDMESISNSFENLTNWGVSFHRIQFGTKWFSVKLDGAFNFIELNEKKEFSMSIMGYLGLSPFHNRYFYLGLYGGLGIDFISSYSCLDVAGCGVFNLNLSENVGIFVNVDAAYRVSGSWFNEETPDPGYKVAKMWKLTPSIGLSFKR